MILSSLGKHTQLAVIDKEGNRQNLFTATTSDTVYVNESGDTLDMYLPTVVDNLDTPSYRNAVTVLQTGEIDVTDETLLAALQG